MRPSFPLSLHPLLAPLLTCHAYLFEVLEPSKPGPTKLWLAFSTARKAHPQISVQVTPHVPKSHPLMLYVDLCILFLPPEPGRGLSCRCPCSVPRTRAVLGFTVGWWDGRALCALRSAVSLAPPHRCPQPPTLFCPSSLGEGHPESLQEHCALPPCFVPSGESPLPISSKAGAGEREQSVGADYALDTGLRVLPVLSCFISYLNSSLCLSLIEGNGSTEPEGHLPQVTQLKWRKQDSSEPATCGPRPPHSLCSISEQLDLTWGAGQALPLFSAWVHLSLSFSCTDSGAAGSFPGLSPDNHLPQTASTEYILTSSLQGCLLGPGSSRIADAKGSWRGQPLPGPWSQRPSV